MKGGDSITNLGRRGQTWGLDAIVASAIFVMGIVILFVYSINYSGQTGGEFENLYFEGFTASELILDEEGNGILSEGKINQTKLEIFYDLDYEIQKNSVGVINEFYFEIPGMEVLGVPVDYVGQLNTSTISNLAVIERIAIYNETPVTVLFFTYN